MRHRKHTFKIGRTSAHRKSLLANQVCSLIYSGEIRTTVTKAKETRRLAEKMVTLGKKNLATENQVHHRRLAISKLRDKDAVRKLFEEIAPQYETREGGYTRIIRLGQRLGDNADMCILQWVSEEVKPKKGKKKKAKKEKAAEEAPAKTEKAESEAEPADVAPKAEAAVTEAQAESKEETPAETEQAPAEEAKEETKEEDVPAEDTADQAEEEKKDS